MIHHMKLNPAPFYQMRKGAKTIELRLYDPKRRRITIGDQIRVVQNRQVYKLVNGQVKKPMSKTRYSSN